MLALTAERNPDVRAAREAWRAQLCRFDQAACLEQLVWRYRSFVRELDITVGPQSHKEMPDAQRLLRRTRQRRRAAAGRA